MIFIPIATMRVNFLKLLKIKKSKTIVISKQFKIMKNKLLFFAAIVCCFCSCTENNTKKSGGVGAVSSSGFPVDTQIVFCLSMISNLPAATLYSGPLLINNSAIAAQSIISYASGKMDSTLEYAGNNSPTADSSLSSWKRVWGPAVTALTSKYITYMAISMGKEISLDSNYVSACSMTIFNNGNNYVVAIQATNPYCEYAWDSLDFNVGSTMPWTYFDNTSSGSGNLSRGTYLGLNGLMALQSNNTSAVQFLDSVIADSTKSHNVNIVVTGHSLGGALSPVFALYMLKQVNNLNKSANAFVYCMSTAGATPGDSTFAQYYNNALQPNTLKVWNYYDVVPRAWVSSLLTPIDSPSGLYQGTGNSIFFDSAYDCGSKIKQEPVAFSPTPTPKDIVTKINGAIKTAAGKNYTHICGGGYSFAGPSSNNNDSIYLDVPKNISGNPLFALWLLLYPSEAGDSTFISQVGAQHVSAYALHYNIKPIHEYMRAIVERDGKSVVNMCGLSPLHVGQSKAPSFTYAPNTTSLLFGLIAMSAWRW